MSDYAGAIFLGSPNHSPGRRAFKYVVLHTMVGSETSANARFQNPAQQASSNYGVKLNGQVVCWVHEADTAYANGTYFDNPGANVDSISIEHEDNGDYNGPRTPALYEASAKLVADICKRRGIPIDRAHILKHKECKGAVTACPDSLKVDGIVARAKEIAALSPPSGIGSGADPGNLPGDDMSKLAEDQIQRLYDAVFTAPDPKNPYAGSLVQLASKAELKQLSTDLKALLANIPAGGGGLSATDSKILAGIAADAAAIRMRVEKDLAP